MVQYIHQFITLNGAASQCVVASFCTKKLLNVEIVKGRVENVILHLIHAAPSAVWHKQNRHIGSRLLTVYCFHPAFKNAKHLGQVEIPVSEVKL